MRSNNAIASLLPGRRLDTARVRQTGVLPDGSGGEGASAFQARAWNVALVALPAAIIFVLGYMRRHVTDDALIYCRTVRQILAGNGPVFNVGERAEASTSSLWQWLLALAGWATRINVEQLAVFGGLLLTSAGFVVALVATRRLQSARLARGCTLIPGGILLLLALPPVWDYATSGLESGLQTFWLASCWWFLVGSHSTARLRFGVASLVTIGLGPLVRPELSLVSLVFVVAILVNLRVTLRMAIFGIMLASLPPIAYEIFRAGYYGLLVPLPALAKEAAIADLSRGSAYLWDFIEPYWLAVPLLAVGVLLVLGTLPHSRAGDRRSGRSEIVVITAPVLSSVALTAYVTSNRWRLHACEDVAGPSFLVADASPHHTSFQTQSRTGYRDYSLGCLSAESTSILF